MTKEVPPPNLSEQEAQIEELITQICSNRDQIVLNMWAPGGKPRIPLELDNLEAVMLVSTDNIRHGEALWISPDGTWNGKSGNFFGTPEFPIGVLNLYALITDETVQALDNDYYNKDDAVARDYKQGLLTKDEAARLYEEHEREYDEAREAYIEINKIKLLTQFNNTLDQFIPKSQ